MCSALRPLVLLGTLLGTATLCPSARAWVETAIKSDAVTVDVERGLGATVSHDLLMQVRGGPLKSFELAGADSDAEPLPDATVTRAQSGGAGASPVPLLVGKRDDGTLVLEADDRQGLARGLYLFKFRYHTNLGRRGLVSQRGTSAEVRWIGPRLPDGVDGAAVVFRLPAAPAAPHVVASDRSEAMNLADPVGVFLSNLRRGSEKDELEVVRPHVSKGEPVVWRVEADSRAFDAFAPAGAPPAPVLADPPLRGPAERLGWFGGGLAATLLYAMLVFSKWRALVRACNLRKAKPRALLPLPGMLRAVLAGLLLSAAAVVAKVTSEPTLGGLLLLASMALATHVGPGFEAELRGPGRWLPLTDHEAFQSRRLRVPGRWLDAGTWPGFGLFVVALGMVSLASVWMLGRSPYDAMLIALASAALFPIFLTGRTSELAPDPVTRSARLLRQLANRLRQNERHKVVAWARIPDQQTEPDELRLLLVPRPPVRGLVAIEVGMEHAASGNHQAMTPCLLVRVLEGSSSHQRLGQSVPWMRGRTAEERVALLRPKLPTFGLTHALVERVLALLTDDRRGVRRPRHPEIKTPIPGGRTASTTKPRTPWSPAQAT